MKKTCLFVAAALLVLTQSAMAQSIAGKFGVTARGGFIVPADSKLTASTLSIDTDTGWSVGGGIIYGITNNLAADLDVTYSEFKGKTLGLDVGTAKTTDISLGFQYRIMPKNDLVPYVGAGFDIILNDFKAEPILGATGSLDADTTFGGHISAGVDYFITKQVALNAEFKGVLSSEGDVKDATGFPGIKFDPSNFSGLFGVRFFFQ